MFKFIIFAIIGFYILFKIVGFLFRVLFSVMGSNMQNKSMFEKDNFKYAKKANYPPDGNVNVDFIPKEQKTKPEFKGGEYVDYEEVK